MCFSIDLSLIEERALVCSRNKISDILDLTYFVLHYLTAVCLTKSLIRHWYGDFFRCCWKALLNNERTLAGPINTRT